MNQQRMTLSLLKIQVIRIAALNGTTRIHLFASSTRDALLLARSGTIYLDSSQVRIPNPRSMIHFLYWSRKQQSLQPELPQRSPTESKACLDSQSLSQTKLEYPSSTAIQFLRKSKLEFVSLVQKGSIILFSIIIIFNDFQTSARK